MSKVRGKGSLVMAEVEATLTSSSREILNKFLLVYAEKSRDKYKNAILNFYHNEIKKTAVVDWDYNDFLKVVPKTNLTPQQSYMKSFFLYLYIHNHLSNEKNFNLEWVKDKELQKYKKKYNKKNKRNNVNNSVSLSLEEVFKIQSVLQNESNDIQDLKKQFCWYAIFDLGLDVEVLRNHIDAKRHYIDSKLEVNDKIYLLPDKFKYMFEKLKQRKDYSGFMSLEDLTKQLGEMAGLERGLIPQYIKSTREKFKIECGSCKMKFMNLEDFWVVINGHIVCRECGETLRKKYNIPLGGFQSSKVDSSDKEINKDNTSFEEKRIKLKNTKIDYLKLHEFQMQIGELGELFAYNYERRKLAATKYFKLIDPTKALNEANGYDVLSYDLDGKELFIEVKSTVNSNPVFYVSKLEVETYKRVTANGGQYYIYLITNVLSDNPTLTIIKNFLDDDRLTMEETGWKVVMDVKNEEVLSYG